MSHATDLDRAGEVLAVPVKRAAEMIGLSREQLYRFITGGQLRAIKPGVGRTLVTIDELKRFLAACPTVKEAPAPNAALATRARVEKLRARPPMAEKPRRPRGRPRKHA